MKYHFTFISVIMIIITGIFLTQPIHSHEKNDTIRKIMPSEQILLLSQRTVGRYPVRRATRKLRAIRSQRS
jgi:hypothetical protein